MVAQCFLKLAPRPKTGCYNPRWSAALADSMIDLPARVREQFTEASRVLADTNELLAPRVAQAAELVVQCLMRDGKLLVCGNGGEAAQAQHLVAELQGRFRRARPGLPAIALCGDSATVTALGNDYGYEEVFAKQVQALGHAGDTLVGFCVSGNSSNILAAINAAQERGMPVVALTGRHGGQAGELLGRGDVHLCVPHDNSARVQEMHTLIIHCLCEAIDLMLLGEED